MLSEKWRIMLTFLLFSAQLIETELGGVLEGTKTFKYSFKHSFNSSAPGRRYIHCQMIVLTLVSAYN